MQLKTLGELSVGALFVRHDMYGDGKTIHVKLAEPQADVFGNSCWCGTPALDPGGHINSSVQVQELTGGEFFGELARRLSTTRPEN